MCIVITVRVARLTLCCVQSDRREGARLTLCCMQGLRKHVYMEHRKTNKKELEDLTIADMKFTVRLEGGVRLF